MASFIRFIQWLTAPPNLIILSISAVFVVIGAWQTRNVMQAFAFGAAAGVLALWVGAVVLFATQQEIGPALSIGLRGLGVVILLAALLAYALPPLRLSFEVGSSPTPLNLEILNSQRPTLPQYVELHGRIMADLTIEDQYSAAFINPATGRAGASSQWVYHTPIVGESWTPAEPVNVVITTPPSGWNQLETDLAGQQIVTGILYPVVPRAGEFAWLDQRENIGTLSWYQNRADFEFNPDQFFLLDTVSPLWLRVPALLVIGGLVIVGFVARWVYLQYGVEAVKQQG